MIPLLLLLTACAGGNSVRPVATPQPDFETTVTTNNAARLDTGTVEVPEIGEDCVPLGPDTDEVYQDDIYANLIMEPAQIRDSDLPVDSINSERSGVSLYSGQWNNRLRMVKKDSYPLARLETLRNLGVLGEWFNSRKLLIGPIVSTFPDAVPQHFVEVRTFFFESPACAHKFLTKEVQGEEILLSTFAFDTKAFLSRSELGEETKTELALVAPPDFVIWVKSCYQPATEDIETVFPGYNSNYPDKAARIQQADSPDFVDIASLAETLANRLWQQISAASP